MNSEQQQKNNENGLDRDSKRHKKCYCIKPYHKMERAHVVGKYAYCASIIWCGQRVREYARDKEQGGKKSENRLNA